ncbi:MAG: glycosyltransferase family 2 protein [Alphaproteobacteria bacterium]|nr:glycosyltransferase family 2 protein [Alphaproteobacteria bacterium]
MPRVSVLMPVHKTKEKYLPFISCKFKRKITTLLDLKKLSVIITVYNEKPEYIERAITSLNNQNFQNLEIIVVNDGSKNEDTIRFLNNLKQDNLKIINKENGGPGSARNLGLQHTSGDVVGFLDADDWVEKDFYSELMYNLIRYNADVACGVLICNGKSYDKFPRYIASTVQEKLKYINNGSVCSKIFKKELFNDIKFSEAKIYYEDNPVLLKLLLQADKVSFNPKAEYIYFTNDTSITRNKDESKEQKRIDDSVLILEQIKKWADSYDKKTSDLIMLTVGQILFRAWQYTKNENYRKKIDKIFTKEQMAILIKPQLTFAQKIFSLKKSKDKSYKIITFLGFQIKWRLKK